jgi:xylulokinase
VDRHILAIELGASAFTVALVSVAGDVIATEHEIRKADPLPGGGAEQDSAGWWELIARASSRLAGSCVVPPTSIAAVCCTSQCAVTVPHIGWFKNAEPEAYRRAPILLEPRGWLKLRLTGRYDPALLRLAGLNRAQLPDLMAATDILGPLLPGPAAALGVPAGIPVVVGAPEMASVAIGSGATRDFQAHLYVGASSWLTCHVPFRKSDLMRNMTTLPSAIPGRCLVAGEQETAGPALAFLRDRLLFPAEDAPADAYHQFDAMAASSPPGSRGLIFTPWRSGEQTPVQDHFMRDGFRNLSLSARRDDLIRGVLEGMALNTRRLLPAAERFARCRLEPIRFVGGGARSDVWCQIFADVLDRTIEQVADPVHASARGAAMLAAVALGDLNFFAMPSRIKVARSYRPNGKNCELYAQLLAEFVGFYKRDRKAHARMNRNHATD